MPESSIDRFKVLVGSKDFADHIVDMAEFQPDAYRNELKEKFLFRVGGRSPEKLEKIETTIELIISALTGEGSSPANAEDTDILKRLARSYSFQIPGELVCAQGRKSAGENLVSLSAYTETERLNELDFDADPPKKMCSICWPKIANTLDKEAELEEQGVTDRIGTVSYRFRWKQKGRAREEWYDIVVLPETTMAELDSLVCRFSTLDDFHLRMYGLEDEYLDSSINVVPDNQHSRPSDTPASEVTIAELAEQITLWEGDRLSLVYDYGTPSHYYCIVKEVYDPPQLDAMLSDTDLIAETETAAIVDQKRP